MTYIFGTHLLEQSRIVTCAMQSLLGAISRLTTQQQQQEQHLLQQEVSIRSLAAAIPTAQAALDSAGSGSLHCSLAALELVSNVRGGGSGSRDVLACTLSLQHTSEYLLLEGWCVLLTHSHPCGGDLVMLAAPLGRLKPGAEWKRQCHVPVGNFGGTGFGCSGHLRILLCRHGNNVPGLEAASCSPLLLHSVKWDALHLLQPRRGSSSIKQLAAPGGQTSPGVRNMSLSLQLPRSLGHGVPATQLLQQLVAQGLSSKGSLFGQQESHCQSVGLPAGPFSLLMPPNQHSALLSDSFSSSTHMPASVTVTAEAAAAQTGRSGAFQLRVTAGSDDLVALLECHRGLSQHAQRLVQGAAGKDAQHCEHQSQLNVLAASAAAASEQVLLQLRQMRAAAMQLRSAAECCPLQAPCDVILASVREKQHTRHVWQLELLNLVLATRQTVASLPLVLS